MNQRASDFYQSPTAKQKQNMVIFGQNLSISVIVFYPPWISCLFCPRFLSYLDLNLNSIKMTLKESGKWDSRTGLNINFGYSWFESFCFSNWIKNEMPFVIMNTVSN